MNLPWQKRAPATDQVGLPCPVCGGKRPTQSKHQIGVVYRAGTRKALFCDGTEN